MIGRVITLSEYCARVATNMGRTRRFECRAADVVDQLSLSPEEGEETDIEAAGSEFAFSHLFNVCPDFTTHPRRGGCDLRLSSGLRVDVKRTRHAHGWLTTKTTKERGNCDLFALMTGTLPTYTFRGFATEEALLSAPLRDFGRGKPPGPSLPQSVLREEDDVECEIFDARIERYRVERLRDVAALADPHY